MNIFLQIIKLMQIKTVKLQFIATEQTNFKNKSQLPMILKVYYNLLAQTIWGALKVWVYHFEKQYINAYQ